MYCRKCGNKLSDDDAFCSKCGAKVINDLPPPKPSSVMDNTPVTDNTPATDNAPVANNTPATEVQIEYTEKKRTIHPVVKFFLYLIAFVVITILIYAMILPPKLSVIDFIKDPRGLAALVGSCIGAGLAAFLAFWPLLGGLSNLGIIPKHWKVEAIFLLAFTYEIGSILFGMNKFARDIMTPILIGALFLGIPIRIFTSSKKK